MMRWLLRLLGGALCLCSFAAQAHKPSDSYLRLVLVRNAADGTLSGQWDISLRDMQHAIGIDQNGDGIITWGELKSRQAALTQYAFSRLSVEGFARGDRQECPLRAGDMLFDEHVDGGYAVLRFTVLCPMRPAHVIVHYRLLFELDPNHRGLLEVRTSDSSQAFVLSSSERTVTANLENPDRLAQFRAFLEEGIWHIWKGYDHILFLLTLLLPAVVIRRAGQWQPRGSLRDALVDVLKVVTAFTLAHSLTLSLAVNGWVNLPSRLVESAIALTVLLGALNNLFPFVCERRWLVAFCFGLIHGLGFASVLTDMGLRSWNLALALIGFNAGVEVGQLAIVMVLVPAAFALRSSGFYRTAFMPVGAVAISCIATYWLIVRATGLAPG